jgi:hypothetical protein
VEYAGSSPGCGTGGCPLIARVAVEAYNVGPNPSGSIPPPTPEELRSIPAKEHLSHPYFAAQLVAVGESFSADFGAYAIAGRMLLPVLESALNADPIDEDLVRRCCSFLEAALAGEEVVAGSINMMVAENFGTEYSRQVQPYAGPLFLQALRSWKWIEEKEGTS